MGQSVFTLGLLFVVNAVVARYLGAEAFGLLSYTLAIAAILAVFGQFGLDNLVVRELVGRDSDERQILGTGFVLRAIACAFASIAMIAFGHFTSSSVAEQQLFFLAALFFLAMPLLISDLWLQAHEKARSSSISQAIGQIVSAIAKLMFVLSAANLAMFGLGNAIQALVASGLAYYFCRLNGSPPITKWQFSFPLAKKLVPEGCTYFLGALLGIIYLKIDIVMLRWMVGAQEVGLYSVAAQFSEAFYFVPGAILAATFPALVRLKENSGPIYQARFRQIMDVMLWSSLAAMALVAAVGPVAISLLFGSSYEGASLILILHVFAMPFIFMGTAFVRWLLVERYTMIILLTQGIGAIVNVLLNLVLIPAMQGRGAALATVLSYMVAYYLAVGLHPRTRPIFFMMSSALFKPWQSARRAYHLRSEL